MVSVVDLIESEQKCHVARDFTEYSTCIVDLNKEVEIYLVERFGPVKGRSCNHKEFLDRKIGNFIMKSMDIVGLSMDDIQDVQLDCERGSRNVIAIITKGGKKIWIKATGANRPITITEIVLTKEVSDFANLIGEDVPYVINEDLNNNLIALSDIKGIPLDRGPSIYNTFSPTEIATNVLFEIYLQDGDRVRDNVRREDRIISEIDFAAFGEVKSFDHWRNSKFSNNTLKRLFNDLEHIQHGGKSIDPTWTKDFIISMKQKIEDYYTKQDLIKAVAPHLYEWNNNRADNIIKELEVFLNKTEQSIKK